MNATTLAVTLALIEAGRSAYAGAHDIIEKLDELADLIHARKGADPSPEEMAKAITAGDAAHDALQAVTVGGAV